MTEESECHYRLGQEISPYHKATRPALGFTQPPTQRTPGSFSRGKETAAAGSQQLAPSYSADAMNAAYHDSSILLRGMGLKSMHRHNFYLCTRNYRKYTKHHVHGLNPHQIHTDKRAGMLHAGSIRLTTGRVAGPCQCGNISMIYIRNREFLNCLTSYQLIIYLVLWTWHLGRLQFVLPISWVTKMYPM